MPDMGGIELFFGCAKIPDTGIVLTPGSVETAVGDKARCEDA
jgi:hypothetical protein